tara:strand:+ start:1046 stop:1612 length:567 start_codon:yes stop_codon:yes gene_type:complete
MKRLLLTSLALWMTAAPLHAEMLKESNSIPSDFKVQNVEGKSLSFADLKGEQGAVLLFVRSLDWCPYCKKQVKDWNGRAEQLQQMGYPVTAISYDPPLTLQEFGESEGITFPLVSDKDSKLIKAFGILNTDFSETDPLYGIPEPTIYVVDAEGKITHVYQEDGYKRRPDPDVVIQDLSGELGSETPTE